MQQDDVTQPVNQENEPTPVDNEVQESIQDEPLGDDNAQDVENMDNASDEVATLKATLARLQADYDNFKKRIERDKQDMMLYMRADILGKMIPRLDDMERILKNTPQEEQQTPMYKGLEATYTAMVKDLEKMGVVAFESKGHKVDPDYHEVMTQAPGEDGIIIDDFMKGYMVGERVLRHAKVVVGNGM